MERRKFVQSAGAAAIAWPLPALAQRASRSLPLVAVLLPTTEERAVRMTSALRDGCKQAGLVEGVDYAIALAPTLSVRPDDSLPAFSQPRIR